MKTVELKDGDLAITIITKTYVTKKRMASILSNLAFYGKIDLEHTTKSDVIKAIREHISYQGLTTYCDWYEDTQDTEFINALYIESLRFIEVAFPELN